MPFFHFSRNVALLILILDAISHCSFQKCVHVYNLLTLLRKGKILYRVFVGMEQIGCKKGLNQHQYKMRNTTTSSVFNTWLEELGH